MSSRLRAPFLLAFLFALFACFPGATGSVLAQSGPLEGPVTPEEALERDELAAHLRFLASDELEGRKAGTHGADVAARYIAEQFRAAGLSELPGAPGYLQTVPLERTNAPESAHLVLGSDTLRLGGALLQIAGSRVQLTAPVVYAGYGLAEDDYAGLEVDGRIVVVEAGRPGASGGLMSAAAEKRRLAAARGAAVVVELYHPGTPWNTIREHLSRGSLRLPDADDAAVDLPHFWADDTAGRYGAFVRAGASAAVASSGLRRERVTSSNVAGFLEGRDPQREHEVIVLLAHYDHLGVRPAGEGEAGADRIFNGARDNAMGVVALLGAAEALGAAPPARSVLVLAATAEEGGLLGSRYYTEHPLVPLERTVFALNIDGAGYSDTSAVTLVGLGRTTADEAIRAGAAAFGLEVIADPAPEQNLFDRSDNVRFAAKGVPAPTFSPGFRAFSDPGVSNYYHQPGDEADASFDYDYLHRFVQAYARAARNIAERPERPRWTPGDRYEAAARALYGEEQPDDDAR